MAIINITRVAEFNSETNRYEQPILVADSNGNVTRDTQILSTEAAPSAPGTTVLLTDNLSDSVQDSKISYNTSSNYNLSSLSVYYNGLNITNDIKSKTESSFEVSSEYSNIIKNGDSIIAIYTVK